MPVTISNLVLSAERQISTHYGVEKFREDLRILRPTER